MHIIANVATRMAGSLQTVHSQATQLAAEGIKVVTGIVIAEISYIIVAPVYMI